MTPTKIDPHRASANGVCRSNEKRPVVHVLHYYLLAETARLAMLCYGAALTTFPRWHFSTITMRTVHGSLYTFSVKPKWLTVVFCFIFAAPSSAEAYLSTSFPREHSTVGVPKRCEGFVAIWLRAREEFAYNRFQCTIAWCHMVPHLCPLDNNMHLTQWADYTVVDPKCSSIHESWNSAIALHCAFTLDINWDKLP